MKCLCVPQRTHSCFTGLSIAFLFLWMWNENIDAIYICSYCWKKLIFHSINRMLFLWRGPGFKGILFFMSISWFKMSGDSGINSWAGMVLHCSSNQRSPNGVLPCKSISGGVNTDLQSRGKQCTTIDEGQLIFP